MTKKNIHKYFGMKLSLFVFLMIICNIGQGTAIGEDVDVTLARKIDKFEIVNLPLAEAVGLLRYKHKIRICLEEVEYAPSDTTMTKTTEGSLIVINKKNISVNLTDATVEEILNNLTLQDKDYFWEVSPSGIINVLPRSASSDKYGKSVLNWNIPKLLIDGEELIRIGGTAHFFGRTLMEHGIGCEWVITGPMGPNSLSNRLIYVNIINGTARECLNAVVKSAGDDCFWTLDGYKKACETKIGIIELRSLTFGSF